jgi:acyl carrier protein/NAD(P)-dependent dehydrogenase (short-subunit alcohol dehydrogenase family)
MLEIVSDKTGYPVEMLELSMDIEADLGIDSIKRVEILGAMRDRYPELPQLKPEELAELRTLQQIVDYMNAHGGSSAPEPIAAPVATPATPEPIADPEAEAIARSGGQLASTVVTPGELNSVVDSSALAIAMLEIVSDKTGYPVEMLELSMDIEADLGIDSIKRVEILGAMRDRYPELPQLKPEELAELRTLQQIVDYMNAHGGSSAAVPAAPQPQSAPAPAPAAVTQAVPVAPVSAPGIDLAALSSAMLEIVSDKTGYPVEMLELSMDIEADLGIDSIKRVEILGAMRDRFPQLPQLKPEELAELRTLQQIVDYMAAHVNGPDTPDGGGAPSGGVPFNEGAVAAVVPPGAVVTTSGTNGHRAALPRLQHDIPRQAARLNFLPQPDTLDIDLPAGSVVVITDDGSGLTAEVAGRLASREWPVVILTLPPELIPAPAPLPVDVPRLTLPDLTETQLTTALEEIAGQYGRIAAFIHLNPALKAANGDLFAEREKAILKQVFLIAKHLKKPLNDSAERGFGAFVTVARLDGAFGTSKAMESSVISAGLFGLTKSVNLEWPRVFCRALDLAADLSATAGADHVLAELHDPNRLVVEVGYGAQGRVTLVTADQVPGAAA